MRENLEAELEELRRDADLLKHTCSELTEAKRATEIAIEQVSDKSKQDEIASLQEKEALSSSQKHVSDLLEAKGDLNAKVLLLQAELDQEKAAHAATNELVKACEDKHNSWVQRTITVLRSTAFVGAIPTLILLILSDLLD